MLSALERISFSVNEAIGWAVYITGWLGSPHIFAIALEVSINESVHIVMDGMPAFSTWSPSCTLHALHEPQSPTPTIT